MCNLKLLSRYLLAALFLLVSINAQDKYDLDETYEGVKLIKAETVSSDMIIKKSGDDKVHLKLRVTFDEPDNYEPIVELRGSKLYIEEEFYGSTYGGNARWMLEIPDGMKLDFSTASGDIKITDLKIDVKSGIASGDVWIENCNGDFRIHTASGDVELMNSQGDFNIDCASGKIDFSKCTGEFNLQTASGNIRTEDCEGIFELSVASGDVDVRNVKLTGTSEFEAASGDVEIEVTEVPEFDLKIQVASGDAELYVPAGFSDVKVDLITREDDGRIVTNFDVDEEETFTKKRRNRGWGESRRKTTYVRQTINKDATKAKILIRTESGNAVLKSR